MTEYNRVYNFSAGPSMLPLPVLEKVRDQLLNYEGSGQSVMEMSHRSAEFKKIIEDAEKNLRDLMEIPDNYRVLFVQGGGTLQFSMVPLNLLRNSKKADYAVTGSWAKKRTRKPANSAISEFSRLRKMILSPGCLSSAEMTYALTRIMFT